MGMLTQYIEEQAAAKDTPPADWLQKRTKEIPYCKIGTHVGKFSHPDAKITIYDKSSAPCNGYVLTENSAHRIDIAVNAAYMGAAKLLELPLEDGHTVFWHIVHDSHAVEVEFQAAGISREQYLAFKMSVLQCSQSGSPDTTDDVLKQVYFPVNQTDYHLLTVMPSSSLLMRLKETIDRMEQEGRCCRDTRHEKYGSDYDAIWDLTAVSFGGTKPQNISYLNNANGGAAYILPSVPPALSGQTIRLPKKNVFKDSVSLKSCEYTFRQLHRLFACPRNSMEIREKIKEQVQHLIEIVVSVSYAIRSHDAGWSDAAAYAALPDYQKIWLDAQYVQERQGEDWRDELSAEFGRWLIRTYEKLIKRIQDPLGDEEMKFFKYEFKNVLDEVVRYE